jgi:hypothetical protein
VFRGDPDRRAGSSQPCRRFGISITSGASMTHVEIAMSGWRELGANADPRPIRSIASP